MGSAPGTSRSPSGCFSAGVDDCGDINGEVEWEVISLLDEGIGDGRVGGLPIPSKGANLALAIERNKFEPISLRNLPSFLSVVVWFVSGESRKFVDAKLASSPSSTPCGGTVSDSFVRATLI